METNSSSDTSQLAEQLRRLLLAIEASGQSILPSSNDQLLQTIVEAAAFIFGAAAASMALVDESGEQLVFRVAHGAGAEAVVGMRIPIHKGIAGYVALTGQPIAISNVLEDTRFNQDFAKSTGYVPASILAVPLISRDQVIGVMEVLDKISAPSFGLQDMELMGLFARQAALAIDQSQHYDQLGRAFLAGLKRLAEQQPGDSSLLSDLLESAGGYREDGNEILELADLYYEISNLGASERRLLLQVFSAFRGYRRARPGYVGFGGTR